MTNEVVGVDAFRRGRFSGWVAVVLRGTRFARAALADSLLQLIGGLPEAVVIAIDMPIGLPTDGQPRLCDVEARQFVGPRGSSVFRAPPREALLAATHSQATKLSVKLTEDGVGMPLQAFGLREKIFELEPIADADERIVEVHPEVSFREMAGAHIAYAKSSWSGQMLRRELLADDGILLPDQIGEAGLAAPDDLLDAAAAAWSARRVTSGSAVAFPEAVKVGAKMTISR